MSEKYLGSMEKKEVKKMKVYIIVENGMFRNIVRVCNKKVVAYALANLFNNNCNNGCYFTVEEHNLQNQEWFICII